MIEYEKEKMRVVRHASEACLSITKRDTHTLDFHRLLNREPVLLGSLAEGCEKGLAYRMKRFYKRDYHTL